MEWLGLNKVWKFVNKRGNKSKRRFQVIAYSEVGNKMNCSKLRRRKIKKALAKEDIKINSTNRSRKISC